MNPTNVPGRSPSTHDPDLECCPVWFKENRHCVWWSGGLTGLILVIVIIVCTALHFSPVEKDQWGLVQDKYTGQVDTSRHPYGLGHHPIGINKKFLTFPRPVQRVDLNVTAFTDNQVEVFVPVTFYYQLIPENLGRLYLEYPKTYSVLAEARANSAMKGISTSFSVQNFLLNRTSILKTFWRSVKTSLSEIYLEVPEELFTMGGVQFPPTVDKTNLETAAQNQRNEEAKLNRILQNERSKTQVLLQEISANITRVEQAGVAAAQRIRAEARAESSRILESAETRGLNDLLQAVNATDPGVRTRLIRYYLRREHMTT